MKIFKRSVMHATMNYIDHVDYVHIVTAVSSFGFRFKYWLSTIFSVINILINLLQTVSTIVFRLLIFEDFIMIT